MESQFEVSAGNSLLDVNLSEQIVISCIHFGSCDNGGTADGVEIHLKGTGVSDEGCYRYVENDGNRNDRCDDREQRRYLVEDWHMRVLPWSEQDRKAQLVRTPIIAQMQV